MVENGMTEDEDTTQEGDRLQRLAGSQGGFDPLLREQIETSLHAGYAWNAKYAKYGVIWVWFFWVLKWGFAAAAVGAAFGGLAMAVGFGLDSPWFLWLAAVLPLGIGHLFFGLIRNGMDASHRLELELAERYRSSR